MTNLIQIDLTRQELLQIWLKRNGLKQVDLARELDVNESSLSVMLRGETISSLRHGQLVKLGLPAELLPSIVDKKPGPKRKTRGVIAALST